MFYYLAIILFLWGFSQMNFPSEMNWVIIPICICITYIALRWALLDDLKHGRLNDDANWPSNPPSYNKPKKEYIVIEEKEKKKNWYEKREEKKKLQREAWDKETDAILEAMAMLDDDDEW